MKTIIAFLAIGGVAFGQDADSAAVGERANELLNRVERARSEENQRKAAIEFQQLLQLNWHDSLVSQEIIDRAAKVFAVRLKERDSADRATAYRILVWTAGKEQLAPLQAALGRESDWDNLRAAAQIVARLGNSKSAIACLERVASTSEHRHEAIETLGLIGGDEAKKSLLGLLKKHPSWKPDIDKALDKIEETKSAERKAAAAK
jgi:HEAT repeat protein